MKRIALSGVVAAGCCLLWFAIVGRKAGPSTPVPSTSVRVVVSPAKASARKPASRHEAGLQPDARRNLSSEEFDRRFHLNGVESMDLQSEMLSAADDLKEQKGLQAQVVSFDGKVLKMLIPGLRIPQSQVEATVQTHLQKAVGEQKAAEIWSDPAGKGSMLAWGWHDALECNVTYTFTKTREENDPANNGTLGNAAFDVEVEYAPGNSGAVDFPKDDLMTVHEFTYATAENTYDFSWNALAKAPAGYFRSEPILGVASRPPPGDSEDWL